MKLFYARTSGCGTKTNFGDELNVYLWKRLLPEGLLNEDGSAVFVGIGTLLNTNWLPAANRYVVFGSGVGYGPVPRIDQRWKVYCVRGPRSAKALGIAPGLGVTDPGILCRTLWPDGVITSDLENVASDHPGVAPGRPATAPRKRFRRSYMPHLGDACLNGEFWRDLCARNDLHYIDPTAPVSEVLSDILATEHLLVEAMHGAVIADAYRVPWTAVRTNPGILDFKWSDWLEGLGMRYEPLSIYRPMFVLNRSNLVRSAGARIVHWQMRSLVRRARPQLSDMKISGDRESRLLELLEECRRDHARAAAARGDVHLGKIG
jgi:succinoglycan biosynthesis protein ExoV